MSSLLEVLVSESSTAIQQSPNELYNPDQLKQLAQDALAFAKSKGASAAEVSLSVESGLSVTVRLGEVETLEYNRDKGLGITVYFGQHKGSASTTDFDLQAVKASVQAACDIARYTAADEYAGLADKNILAKDILDLDLCHPWQITPEQAIVQAQECEAAAQQVDKRITNSEGATLSSHDSFRLYANTDDFLAGYPSSRHSLSCSVIAQQHDNMQRDYWYSLSRDPTDLEMAQDIGIKAAQRTLRRLGAQKCTTCQVPVLFEANIARSMIGHFLQAISGTNLYRKASFLLDQIGKPIFPTSMRIDERPHLVKALGSAPFDSEGVATCARDIVLDGILQSYLLDSYAARRLGMSSTGHASGVHNLYLTMSVDEDFSTLLKTMDRGLLVTELMGQGVNIVTGDYSRGASGFWVEHGEIQYPVEEITIAGQLSDMFRNIQAIGNDLDTRGNICTGSILFDEMTIAGA